MSAAPPSAPAPAFAPGEDPTHLELRFAGPVSTPGRPPVDLDALLAGASLSRVETLEVALRGPYSLAAAAMSAAGLVGRLPALRRLTVSFAAAPDPGPTLRAVDLASIGASRGLAAVVDFILAADADALDALAGDPGAASPTSLLAVLDASRRLRSEGVAVRWTVPVVPALVYRLEALFSLARDEGVDPVLAPTSSSGPLHGGGETSLDDEDRRFVADFISSRLLDEEGHLHGHDRTASYRALRSALARAGHPGPATTRKVAVLHAADADGQLQWTLDWEDRPRPTGSAGGSRASRLSRLTHTRAARSLGRALGAGAVVLEGSYALAQWMRARFAHPPRAGGPAAGRPLERVLLIGAYGGEHIGDAAILAGVLFRIHRRRGTTAAIVMSQRPGHTRHLLAMLDTPFKLDVEPYEPSAIRACLPRVNAVVFAGGPLIDLPRQLVKHLYTVALARRRQLPFLVEGIGPGPFPRWPSEWTARRIVGMAERISVRTSTDGESRLMRGLAPDLAGDPAFDYLATRGPALTRVRERDMVWIERLLHDTAGRVLVGVNLRPIRHLWTVGVPRAKRPAYTRFVEARFEERCAEGLRLFHQRSPVPPTFIFFPMNAIQFGMSDLRSAYRLARALRGEVDFRVWQGDASLDGVVALLRRLDIVIAMRFHAAIFALAQGRRVIGIDYRVGAPDKVAALLRDAGQGLNCCRVDQMAAEWLCQRLLALAPAPPLAPPAPFPRSPCPRSPSSSPQR